jgi:hypothetical protein
MREVGKQELPTANEPSPPLPPPLLLLSAQVIIDGPGHLPPAPDPTPQEARRGPGLYDVAGIGAAGTEGPFWDFGK